ncbi:MAG: cysteine hydrolase [candidate division Zixibacteria bacterium]|nr:cysteine hydrolase [candidate division Zixibacteria bacterium]
MKQTYFEIDTIKLQAKQMLESLRQRIYIRDTKYIPENSALIIIDMQNYFLDKKSHAYIPSAKAIILRIEYLLAEYKKRKLPVIFTRHTNSAEDAKMMNKWWGDLISPDDNLSEIIDDFDLANSFVIEKHQYDAFYETELENILHNKKVKQVVICGVMTNLCCETTTRSAFMRGFEPLFTIDGTATYSEDFHLAALMNLAYGFAAPVLTDNLLTTLKSKNEA